MQIAITRAPEPDLEPAGSRSHDWEGIDPERALDQHEAYENLLTELGCLVRRLPPRPPLPDSIFVEDTAVVLDNIAIITRPGAASRRGETGDVARILAAYRELHRIKPPGTLDGGDVLPVGQTLFTGVSEQTNQFGIAQLSHIVDAFGYRVKPVPLRHCRHLKSAVTRIGPELVLANPDWVDIKPFTGLGIIEVDSREPTAANALLLQNTVIYPDEFPYTRHRLEAGGIHVRNLPASELIAVRGGVTCCSLIFPVRGSNGHLVPIHEFDALTIETT